MAAVLTADDVVMLNQDFGEQVRAYNLLYDCRDCVHLNEDTRLCSMEYPNHMLYDAASVPRALMPNGDLVFCKYFEHE